MLNTEKIKAVPLSYACLKVSVSYLLIQYKVHKICNNLKPVDLKAWFYLISTHYTFCLQQPE